MAVDLLQLGRSRETAERWNKLVEIEKDIRFN